MWLVSCLVYHKNLQFVIALNSIQASFMTSETKWLSVTVLNYSKKKIIHCKDYIRHFSLRLNKTHKHMNTKSNLYSI